jgi:hypothetical protein
MSIEQTVMNKSEAEFMLEVMTILRKLTVQQQIEALEDMVAICTPRETLNVSH